MGFFLGTKDNPVGGGGGIGKVITVGDYAYANSWDIDTFTSAKFSGYNLHARNGLLGKGLWYPNANHPSSYYAATATNNTYVTIADITGATNGGGLYTVAGSKTGVGAQAVEMTVRLTIDGGTPVEHTFNTAIPPMPHYWHIMGKAFTTSSVTTLSSQGYKSAANTQGVSLPGYIDNTSYSAKSIYDDYDATTGTFSLTNNYYENLSVHITDASTAAQAGAPFLHFTSSCKVEIKATTAANSFGVAQILTF